VLVRARENLHLERPELAAQADISYPMLANIEAGRRRASDDIIERLAPVLGLRADRLRHVRNALTHGLVQTGGDVSSYLSGGRDTLHESGKVAADDRDASASEIAGLLSEVLVEQQQPRNVLGVEPQTRCGLRRTAHADDIRHHPRPGQPGRC